MRNPKLSRPFLKWAGGKTRLLQSLLPYFPTGARLIEPFVGAGSVFLATDYPAYVLNDANPDLVATWVALRERPRQYIRDASSLFCDANHSQARYLELRDEFNASADRYRRAVLLPYLNKFGFNGLYRVNRAGGFNVPYGKPASLPLFPFDAAAVAAERLKRAVVLGGDFAAAIEMARPGDVIYCDPPYLDSESGASFTAYTAEGFSLEDHQRLVVAAKRAASRRATVLISNHDTEETRDLYRGLELHPLKVERSISASNAGRGACGELLAILRG
ncbi:DNA adenine methylase [Variovorax sp. HW608]|uniref:DNA adenine methylase n=1 Tax=Variovorax sp. HW608 TaxID=1034889 RepID=UPI00081FFE42|nr:Dam family site-specific DNA-(adenine-N6)-methyltransferase [Variovorax sp. HW608]SCK18443.1 DNA adenine methylase [Variovorax sp. HW608]